MADQNGNTGNRNTGDWNTGTCTGVDVRKPNVKDVIIVEGVKYRRVVE